jgi:NADPH:quinone reductase-like Zn-dependent oxidoreductase
MKAWRIPTFGIDQLSLDEVSAPRPGPGEVLIDVEAVSLNYRDLMMVEGLYNPRLEPQRIPCSDGAGTVTAIGEGVTQVAIGNRVAGCFFPQWVDGEATAAKFKGALGGDRDGMLAQQVALPEHGVIPVPDYLAFAEAATLPCAALTAWNAVVHAGRVRAGDVVLIQGTGGVSCFALQFAHALGARVLGTSSSGEKLERAAKLGLDAGVNYREHLVVEVGGAGTFQQSMAATRVGGVIAQIGVLSGREQTLALTPILHRMLHVQGIYVGSREQFAAMNRALEQTRIQPVVDRIFSFEEAREAFATLKGASHFGKIVISVKTR